MTNQYEINRKRNTIKFFIPKNSLRLIQVTDMHQHHILPFSKERAVNKWIRETCKNLSVDLVANTGDLFCYNVSFLRKRVLKNFEKVVGSQTPWFLAWGNHDNENFRPPTRYGGYDKGRLDGIENLLYKFPHCLYINNRQFIENIDSTPPKPGTLEYNGTVKPWTEENWKEKRKYAGTSGGNYAIEIVDEKNENAIKCILFVFNSRRNIHVPPNARKWAIDYVNTLKTEMSTLPPMFCFYHVPNVEFHTLWEEGKATGFKREGVSSEKENGDFHKFLLQLENVKGCFVGHSHCNDYHAEKDGIMYVYGRKTSTFGYGVDRKMTEEEMKLNVKKVIDGAKLININWEDNTWWFESLVITGNRELRSKTLSLT